MILFHIEEEEEERREREKGDMTNIIISIFCCLRLCYVFQCYVNETRVLVVCRDTWVMMQSQKGYEPFPKQQPHHHLNKIRNPRNY